MTCSVVDYIKEGSLDSIVRRSWQARADGSTIHVSTILEYYAMSYLDTACA